MLELGQVVALSEDLKLVWPLPELENLRPLLLARVPSTTSAT